MRSPRRMGLKHRTEEKRGQERAAAESCHHITCNCPLCSCGCSVANIPLQTSKSIIVPPTIIQLLDNKSVELWAGCGSHQLLVLGVILMLWRKAMAESGPKGTAIPVFLPLPAVLFSDPPSYEDKAPVCLPQLCAEEAAWPPPSPRMVPGTDRAPGTKAARAAARWCQASL